MSHPGRRADGKSNSSEYTRSHNEKTLHLLYIWEDQPPETEGLCPDIFLVDGRPDAVIQISTSENFGIRDVYVVLEAKQGKPAAALVDKGIKDTEVCPTLSER